MNAHSPAIGYYDQACTALNDNNLNEAEALLRKAVELSPGDIKLQLHLGSTLLRQKKHSEAAICFMAGINIEPNNHMAWSQCGVALSGLGQMTQALDSFNHAIELCPQHAPTRNHRAQLLSKMGNHVRALADMAAIIAQSPKDASALYNRGTMLANLDMHERAIKDFRRALVLEPKELDIRANFARSLIELGMYDEACALLKEGLKLSGQYADFHNLLGAAFNGYGKLDESLKHLQRAYVYNPDHLDTLHNLGLTYDDMGRPADAIEMYDEALKLSPDNPDILVCRGFSRLMLGHFSAAWTDLQARTRHRRRPVSTRHKTLPRWRGQDLGQTSLIIHAEQGFGDTLQFCRFVTQARVKTRHIIIEAPQPLLRLLETIPGVDMVTDNAHGITGHQCPFPELPQLLGLDQETIAPVGAYLRAPEAAKAVWAEKIGSEAPLKIGIAWQGRKEVRRAPHLIRSIPVGEILAALPDHAEIYPLQKDITPQDADTLLSDQRVRNLSSDIGDFADSAAIADAMDLVVTIDTAPAHLALALGKPTCVLLPYSADWRWMQQPNSTQWNPTATLFRQPDPGNWSEPLSRLSQYLSRHLDP